MKDVALIGQSFNAIFDNPSRFNHYADLNGNGRLEMRDIGIWAQEFDRSYALP